VKENFIEFLKNSEEFKNKDYQAALKQTFIKIDEELKTP